MNLVQQDITQRSGNIIQHTLKLEITNILKADSSRINIPDEVFHTLTNLPKFKSLSLIDCYYKMNVLLKFLDSLANRKPRSSIKKLYISGSLEALSNKIVNILHNGIRRETIATFPHRLIKFSFFKI